MPKQSFNLENNFYSQDAIQQAIADFEGYSISFDNGVLTIEDDDPQVVFDEFSNYTIAISNESI